MRDKYRLLQISRESHIADSAFSISVDPYDETIKRGTDPSR